MPVKPWCYISVSKTLKAKIDREDLKRVREHKWRVTRATTGRKRVVTTYWDGKGSKQITLGRFLMDPPKDKQVYPRRFNDELDYRKENLVVCSLKERQQMLPKNRMKTSSVYRGVSYISSAGKWRAGIEVDGKSITLGNFENEEDAATAYNKAARQHFGKSAYQNPIGKKSWKRKEG